MKSYSFGTTPVDVIKTALGTDSYPMSLTGEDAQTMESIVNQGIDAHLEAFTESIFNWASGKYVTRLNCQVSPKDMLVLLRRLYEDGSDNAWSLRTDILGTLGIEEI